MKKDRQAAILSLIEKYDIETQEELLERLRGMGFESTQATMSRDIRELNLVKLSVPLKGQKYAVRTRVNQGTLNSYREVLNSGIISMVAAENLIVVKTAPGMAMAVAAALDGMAIEELLGCIAGDDTIFLAVISKNVTEKVIHEIENNIR